VATLLPARSALGKLFRNEDFPMLTFSRDPDIAEQQMCAIIVYLTAFGYIDGEFDLSEKAFVRDYIRKLVIKRAEDAMPDVEAAVRKEVIDRFVTHFLEVFEQIDHEVRSLFSEAVSEKEKVEEFVYAKLKLRAYEIFKSFDNENQLILLESVEELIYADGKVHPAEAKFRDEVRALLDAEEIDLPLEPDDDAGSSQVRISAPADLPVQAGNHPFFTRHEHHYSADPDRIKVQADADLQLVERTMAKLDEMRALGMGKLGTAKHVSAFRGAEAFLDGHTFVHPVGAGEKYEITVLGDLHGCYSCLKAALMQSNFFAKVEAYRLDPKNNPNPKLVLLGDYIDRGLFSYNGVLRTVMQLFLTAPEHVYPLRGNHEYYFEYKGRVYGGVRPAEAINTLIDHMPQEVFETYMRLFEALPNTLLFDRTFFVHAGIPRDNTLREKWSGLGALNDPEIRFEMLWSDPSQTDYIPDELQASNARFPFGRKQFESFMASIGCTSLVRGHEKVIEGFHAVYDSGGATLLNVFSAGGTNNGDLPDDSSYREVTPMALTIEMDSEGSTVTPWVIDYEQFNDPDRNAFFARPPEIEHRS
jgi:hypothetical protein